MIEDLAAVYGWPPSELKALELGELQRWHTAARALVQARGGRV